MGVKVSLLILPCVLIVVRGMTFRKDRRKKSGGAYVYVGYVKHSTSYCSSHIIVIGYNNLMQAAKDDLKELIADNVRLEKLYGANK